MARGILKGFAASLESPALVLTRARFSNPDLSMAAAWRQTGQYLMEATQEFERERQIESTEQRDKLAERN